MATSHATAHQNAPTWTEPPWSGWIESTGDALLILEAARRGLIPRVTRRLVDSERKMITSGSVFVFDEDESGIKRWTDGFFWSPSRILGNFLLYRETDKRGSGHRTGKESDVEFDGSKNDGSLSRPKSDPVHPGVDKQRERSLVGSLTNSYKFKPDGLMKKTFSLTINGVAQHLISYYKIEDVESGRLRPPSSLPELASLEISPEYLDKTHFRNPPKVELGTDGVLRYRGEADDIDTSAASLLHSSPLTGLPLLSGGREVPESAGPKRIKRFDPYGQSGSLPASKRQRKTPAKIVPGVTDPTQASQDDLATPIASPTSPRLPQAPQAFVDTNTASTSPPASAAPVASYPSFGVAPYYGYMQPPPIPMYPHQAPYPALSPTQPIPPPPTHPGQHSYVGYPPPATTSPPSGPPPSNPPTSPSDPSHAQSGGTTTSSPQSQPPINTTAPILPQPGYYHPHAHAAPHPYYPPPASAPGAPHPHSHPHPQMYLGYPPPPPPHGPHTTSHVPPPTAVWGPPPPHPHPYSAYPPAAPTGPPHLPQPYSYPAAYPAPPPHPTTQQPPPVAAPGQYQQAHQTQFVQQGYSPYGQKPDQPPVAPGQENESLKTNRPVARDREGEDGGASE
ncbi:Transcriptional regulator MIT1 [Leucoagaricus sp. SymC.cos]|nr:Transcriptional regulator MIT1 [Leucoagaricus sp. SymC.cos]